MPAFLHALLRPRRRYYEAVFSHQRIDGIETPLREKLWRLLFKPEYADADGHTAERYRFIVKIALAALLWLAVLFVIECARCWDVFSG